jgi:hypothetical protein
MRQDLIAGFCNQNGMFPLGAVFSIHCIDGPIVIWINNDTRFAYIDHRFNGQHHARHQHHTGMFSSDMRDKRILMEFNTNTMAAEFTYYGIALGLCILLNDGANIANGSPWLCCFEYQVPGISWSLLPVFFFLLRHGQS